MNNPTILTSRSPVQGVQKVLLALPLIPLVLFAPGYAPVVLAWLSASSTSANTTICPVLAPVVSKKPLIVTPHRLSFA